MMNPPSASPCSSRKRLRMRSNQGSRSPMKYMPYAWAQSPSDTICVPTTSSRLPAIIECR